MTSRRWFETIAAVGLSLALVGVHVARGQLAGYPSVSQLGAGFGTSAGYGANAFGGVGGNSSLGYGIRTGQIGPGYQSFGNLYGQAYRVARPQTTVALQPLYSAITSLPGWDGPTRRTHHRVRPRTVDPPFPHYDRDGKILWPSAIPDDPATAGLRQAAEAAFKAVVRESKSTGHASIRPVIDAKNRLSAFERKILPGIKARSVTDGDALERFFVDLDRSLDAMNSIF